MDACFFSIHIPGAVKIYLACGATDLRKGFNRLSGIVREWGLDVYSGHLFVFFSRRGNTVEIFDMGKWGLCGVSQKVGAVPLQNARYRQRRVPNAIGCGTTFDASRWSGFEQSTASQKLGASKNATVTAGEVICG